MFTDINKKDDYKPENLSPFWLSFNLFMLIVLFAVLGYLLHKYEYDIPGKIVYFFSLSSLFILLSYHFERQCPHCQHKQPLSLKNIWMTLSPTDHSKVPYACPDCKLLYRRGIRRRFNYLRNPNDETSFNVAAAPRKIGTVLRYLLTLFMFLVAFQYLRGIFSSTLDWKDLIIPVFLILLYLYLHICFKWRDAKSAAKRITRTLYCWVFSLLLLLFAYHAYGSDNEVGADLMIGLAVTSFAIYCMYNIRPDHKWAKRRHNPGPH